MKTPFMGELMICDQCGEKLQSHPRITSHWTTIDVNNMRFYFCPKCLGNAKWTSEQHEAAYRRAGDTITDILKRGGKPATVQLP